MKMFVRGYCTGRLWLLAGLALFGSQSDPRQVSASRNPAVADVRTQTNSTDPNTGSDDHFVYFATFLHSGIDPGDLDQFVFLPLVLRQDDPDLSHADKTAKPAALKNEQGIPGYDGNMYVQNLSSSNAAQVTFTPFTHDGTALPPTSDTLAPGGMKNYPGHALVPSNFSGSMILSSNQPIAAVATVANDDGAAGFAAYEGFQTGSSEVVFPLVKSNAGGFNTTMYAQNVGASQTTITIKHVVPNGSCTTFAPVEPGRAHVYDAGAPPGCAFSGVAGWARLTTSAPSVVATALEGGNNTLFAYNGIASNQAGTELAVPLVRRNSGLTTRFAIQNVSSSDPAEVTIQYSASGPGNSCSQSITVPPNSLLGMDASAFLSSIAACQGTGGWAGSATMSSNEPILAIVQVNTQSDTAAYNAFNSAQATSRVALPLVTRNDSGYTTGIQIMNVGAGPVTVTCTFANSAQTATKSNVAPDTSVTINLNDSSSVDLPNGYSGSALCTSQPNQPIVGVVRQFDPFADVALYNAINF